MSEHIIGAMPDSAREALLEEARAQAHRWYPREEDRLERDAYLTGYLDGRTAENKLGYPRIAIGDWQKQENGDVTAEIFAFGFLADPVHVSITLPKTAMVLNDASERVLDRYEEGFAALFDHIRHSKRHA